MPICVCHGASMQCTFGSAPASLIILSTNKVNETTPGANIMDYKPTLNISPFGMCSAPTNPAVIAATSAASGVATPAPCVPATTTPWAPGNSKVLLAKSPILNNSSKLNCSWAGVISITSAGQTVVHA